MEEEGNRRVRPYSLVLRPTGAPCWGRTLILAVSAPAQGGLGHATPMLLPLWV